MSARNLFVPVLALALAGCEYPQPEELPEDIGAMVVDGMVYPGTGDPQWMAAQFIWSPDGSEIYYLSSGEIIDLPDTWMIEVDIAVVDPQNATSRILATTGPVTGALQLSPDGAWLHHYTQTWDPAAEEPFGEHPEQSFIYARLPVEGGPAETLIERAPYPGEVSVAYALSPDGAVLAFHRGSETPITLYDIEQGIETELDVDGSPVLFSPDGSELLFIEGDAFIEGNALSIASLDDATVTPFISDIPDTAGVHWEGDQLELVSIREVEVEEKWYNEFRVWVTDRRGNERAVTGERDLRHEACGGAALSPDGSQVAASFYDCLAPSGFWGGCDLTQSVLYLIDIESGEVSRIGATQNAGFGIMAFSPDGSRLAYGAGFPADAGNAGDLYVLELP